MAGGDRPGSGHPRDVGVVASDTHRLPSGPATTSVAPETPGKLLNAPAVLMRPRLLLALAYQRAPSGPLVMPNGRRMGGAGEGRDDAGGGDPADAVVARGREPEVAVTAGGDPVGPSTLALTGKTVIAPAVVILPMRSLSWLVNQRLRRGRR